MDFESFVVASPRGSIYNEVSRVSSFEDRQQKAVAYFENRLDLAESWSVCFAFNRSVGSLAFDVKLLLLRFSPVKKLSPLSFPAPQRPKS